MKDAYLRIWRCTSVSPFEKLFFFVLTPFMRPFQSQQQWDGFVSSFDETNNE